MPIIKMPDGTRVRFPDDMPPAQIRELIATKFPDAVRAQQSSGAPEPSAAPTPAGEAGGAPEDTDALRDALFQQMAEQQMGQVPLFGPLLAGATKLFGAGNMAAGLNALSDTASLGAAPALSRTITNAFNPGEGDRLQAAADQLAAENPAGNIAGTVLGIPVGAMAMAPAGAAATAARAVPGVGGVVNALTRGGGVLGAGLRMGAVGAGAGAAEAGFHGEDVMSGAIRGGIAGPVGGAALGAASHFITAPVVNRIRGEGAKAWRWLAKRLGADPDQLAEAAARYERRSGTKPSLQQIVDAHDSGVLAQTGEIQPFIGQELQIGARNVARRLPVEADNIVAGARGKLPPAPGLASGVRPDAATNTAILNTRDDAMDAAIKALNNPDVQISIPEERLRRLFNRLTSDEREQLTNTLQIANGRVDFPMPLADLDLLRRDLDELSRGMNSLSKRAFKELGDDLEAQARKQVAGYGKAIDDYAAASRYADTFEHAFGGAARGEATDAGTRAAMRTSEGQKGFRTGNLARTAKEAGADISGAERTLRDISTPSDKAVEFARSGAGGAAAAQDAAAATIEGMEAAARTVPGKLRPTEAQPGTGRLATAIADMAIGAPISGARQGIAGAMDLIRGLRMSPEAQKRVGSMLASRDPKVLAEVIRELKRAGADNDLISRIYTVAAADAGSGFTEFTSGREPIDITVRGGDQ